LQRIEVRRASVRLGRHWALRDVDFDLRAGEHWLLLGPNGAGKTILLKLLRGDVWPTPTGHEQRHYHFGDGTIDAQPIDAALRIAYLGPERQDRYERYESALDVGQVVLTGFDDSDFPLSPPSAAQTRRIREVLGRVGLAGLLGRAFRSLSYGQRRRVLLARAIVRRPDVLLLDEALNGLDAKGRAAFLRSLRRSVDARTAWVLSSHRRADAALPDVTHVAHIDSGRITQAAPIESGGRSPPGWVHGVLAKNLSRPGRRLRLSEATRPTPLVRLGRAAVYRDGRAVIAAFDWQLNAGEHWYVHGPNGSGKSTLMSMLYGDFWPAEGGGLVRLFRDVAEWKRVVGLVSPELQATYAATGCTVEDIVTSGLHDSIGLNEHATTTERRRVRREIRTWGLDAFALRRARELSYGQLRVVLAARAFIRPRRLYLLDEPFDGLDAPARTKLRERLDTAVARGATLVIASHHAEDVPPYVGQALELRRGRVPAMTSWPVATIREESPPRTR
jgi:molybdate transport system ATP-binding protein